MTRPMTEAERLAALLREWWANEIASDGDVGAVNALAEWLVGRGVRTPIEGIDAGSVPGLAAEIDRRMRGMESGRPE